MFGFGVQILHTDDGKVVALDCEGVGTAAQHLDLAWLVRLDPDGCIRLADVAKQRSHPHLGHSPIMPDRRFPDCQMGDVAALLGEIVGRKNLLTGDAISEDYTHDEALTATPKTPRP